MTTIVSYREQKGVWPGSLKELMMVSEENRKAVRSFPYNETRFRVKKNDVLIVKFSGYKKDPQFSYPQGNQKLDHRMVDGSARFFRSKGKFSWKVFYDNR